MNHNLVFLDPHQYPAWDDFVEKSPQGSIFAKTFYLDAIGRPYRIGVIKRSDGSFMGGIALVKNEIGLYSNPLFAKYLGILVEPMEGKYVTRLSREKRIIEKIVSAISWCKSFDYTFHPSFSNWLPFYHAKYRQETRYTYRIDPIGTDNRLLEQFDSKVRKHIRKAQKNGVRVVGDISCKDFYRVWDMTFKRQGGHAPVSLDRFSNFVECLKRKDSIRLLAALDAADRCHAVSGIVYDNRAAYLIFNGMDPSLPNYEANTLLIFETIRLARHHCPCFDFEGSMIPDIERFYRSFGGVLTPYFNIWKENLLNRAKRFGIRFYKKIKYGR